MRAVRRLLCRPRSAQVGPGRSVQTAGAPGAEQRHGILQRAVAVHDNTGCDSATPGVPPFGRLRQRLRRHKQPNDAPVRMDRVRRQRLAQELLPAERRPALRVRRPFG